MKVELDGKTYDVTELEGKAWHDNDLYLVTCTHCGNSEKHLARRPHQAITKCNCDY